MADFWHLLHIASILYNALCQCNGSKPSWGLINPQISFLNTQFSETIMRINSSRVAKSAANQNLFGSPLLKLDILVTITAWTLPKQLPDICSKTPTLYYYGNFIEI